MHTAPTPSLSNADTPCGVPCRLVCSNQDEAPP
jgi:hypothetical protein